MAENNHIEDFFKKRLESHEFTFQEEDWQLLERKLEISNPVTSRTFPVNITLKTIVLAVAALTAAFLLGWLASGFFKHKALNEVIPVKKEQYQPATRDEKITDNPVTESRGPKNMTQQTAVRKVAAVREKVPVEITAPLHDPEFAFQPIAEKPAAEYKVPVLRPLIPLNAHLPFTYALNEISLVIRESPVEKALPPADTKKIPFRNRWMLGFIVAPDINSIRLLHDNTVTALIGGQLSYDISPRWSVSTGILYNNKKYSGGADYYKLPEGYWLNRTNGIIPDNILGSCRVLDIPLMITYDIIKKEHISFTASAGSGSYLMLDEKYDFEFSQNNPGAETEWKTEKNSGAIFNMANFAIGMEIQTSRKTILAVEPYLKLPLKELGWGKVNLYSMGLYFTMKYRL